MRYSIIESVRELPLNPAQKRLHNLMASEMVHEAEEALYTRSPSALRQLDKSVTQLIQLVSNPLLLASDIAFRHDELLGEVIAEGPPPKVVVACALARRLANKGLKSIVWTSFEKSAESIAVQLADIGAIYIQTRISADGVADVTQKDGLAHFQTDKRCFVMVACPAVAMKLIDLHATCQNAIYLDRTYNVSQYLRSLRCISGVLPRTIAVSTANLLVCAESIDESIRVRLKEKIAAKGK